VFHQTPPVFTSRCCKLVGDQASILFGSTSRRHRLPRLSRAGSNASPALPSLDPLLSRAPDHKMWAGGCNFEARYILSRQREQACRDVSQ